MIKYERKKNGHNKLKGKCTRFATCLRVALKGSSKKNDSRGTELLLSMTWNFLGIYLKGVFHALS